jgi:hypothetical protein
MSDRTPWASVTEKRRFATIAAACFAAAAASQAPAGVGAWALKRAAPLLSVTGADGTIWRGRLTGVSYNGVFIGDIGYRLSPLALFLGRIGVDAQSAGGALSGRARVTLTPGGADFRDVDAEFNLGAIRQYTFFGARYQGLARLKAGRLKLANGGCKVDAATFSTTAFEAISRRWSDRPFPLDGAIACLDGALVASLEGESADGKAVIGLTIRPDFTYGVRIAAQPRRDDVSKALQLFGFENKDGGLSYEAAGVLKGLNS